MTATYANVNIANDTFGILVQRLNQLVTALNTIVVTTNSNTAVGNAAISGTFTANSIAVSNALTALSLVANTLSVNNSITAKSVTANSSTFGNTTVSNNFTASKNVTLGTSYSDTIDVNGELDVYGGGVFGSANSSTYNMYTFGPQSKLTIMGGANVASDIKFNGDVNIAGYTTYSSGAKLSIGVGDLVVSGGNSTWKYLTTNGNGVLSFAQAAAAIDTNNFIANNLTVNTAATMKGTLIANGVVTLASNVTLNNSSATFSVSANSVLARLTVSGNASFTNATTFSNLLTITGNTTISANLSISGNTVFSNNLNIPVTNLKVTGGNTTWKYLVTDGSGNISFGTAVDGTLGTISSQNANNVAITGGTISGVDFDGGSF